MIVSGADLLVYAKRGRKFAPRPRDLCKSLVIAAPIYIGTGSGQSDPDDRGMVGMENFNLGQTSGGCPHFDRLRTNGRFA